MILHKFEDQIVEILRHHAGLDMGHKHVEAFSDQPTSAAHAFKPGFIMNSDAVNACDCVRIQYQFGLLESGHYCITQKICMSCHVRAQVYVKDGIIRLTFPDMGRDDT